MLCKIRDSIVRQFEIKTLLIIKLIQNQAVSFAIERNDIYFERDFLKNHMKTGKKEKIFDLRKL